MNIDLGRATPIYRKQYSDTVVYELNDVVMYTDGNLYWHTAEEKTTGIPPTDATVWTPAFSGEDLRQAMADSVAAAQTAREGAEAAKTDAGAYAAGAGSSAEAAAVSAADSQSAKQDAESARDAAEQSATSAAESALVSKEAADRTEAAAIHQPYPDLETGTWFVWDAGAEAYMDTGVSTTGPAGPAPHIGENGNWYIGETDTGVKAAGADGATPTIGANGNWYIGEEDTGISAEGKAATIEIVGTETLEAGQLAAVEEADGSTPQARKYIFKVPQGKDGDPGATPQRGTDYWTAADQQAIVDDVLAALPAWEGGSY